MERRKLEHGELTRIIIGTVVAADDGISPQELTEKLHSWGIEITRNHASVRLAELATAGRIDRVRHGVYEGM